MKTNVLLLSTAVLTLSVGIPASYAEDIGSNFSFSGNVGFVSEYSFRGIAQSDENPAMQGGFDVEHQSGIYAGVWGSNVDFNDGDQAHLEVDVYAGYAFEFKGLNVDVGAIHYMYPGADSSLNYDFTELTLALGHDFDSFSTTASLNYSPEFFGESGDAFYYALGLDIPVTDNFELSAHIGYQDIDNETAYGVPDYVNWSLGASYAWEGFDFGVQYIDTDLSEPSECADGCDAKIIGSVSRSF